MFQNINNKFIIILFFVLAFLERTFFDLGSNVELVTLAMLLASTYLTRNTALKLTFILMAATDLILGNTRIFVFTWTGFLFPIFPLSKSIFHHPSSIIKPVFYGIGANLFFYLWTNLGVWLLDTWGMYPKTFPGLLQCYYMALPFLKMQLLSTLLFVPLGFWIYHKFGYWLLNIKPFRVYNT